MAKLVVELESDPIPTIDGVNATASFFVSEDLSGAGPFVLP